MNPSNDNISSNESPLGDTHMGALAQVQTEERLTPSGLSDSSTDRRCTRLWTKQQQQKKQQRQRQQDQGEQAMKATNSEDWDSEQMVTENDWALFGNMLMDSPPSESDTVNSTADDGSKTDGYNASGIQYMATYLNDTSNGFSMDKVEDAGIAWLSESPARAATSDTSNSYNEASALAADNSSEAFISHERTVRGKDISSLTTSLNLRSFQTDGDTSHVLSVFQRDYAILFGVARRNARVVLHQWMRANQILDGAAPVVLWCPISVVSLLHDPSQVPVSPNEWFQLYVQQYIPAIQRLLTKRHDVLAVVDEMVEALCQVGVKFARPDTPRVYVPRPIVVQQMTKQLVRQILGEHTASSRTPHESLVPNIAPQTTHGTPGLIPILPGTPRFSPPETYLPPKRSSLRLAARLASLKEAPVSTPTSVSAPRTRTEMACHEVASPSVGRPHGSLPVMEDSHMQSIVPREGNLAYPTLLAPTATAPTPSFSPDHPGHRSLTPSGSSRGVTPSPAPSQDMGPIHLRDDGHAAVASVSTPSPTANTLESPPMRRIDCTPIRLSRQASSAYDWSPIPLSRYYRPWDLRNPEDALALVQIPPFVETVGALKKNKKQRKNKSSNSNKRKRR